MKSYIGLIAQLTLGAAAVAPPLELKYPKAADKWTEALPVGNGLLGEMVFGGAVAEHYQLNEATLWSGAPVEWNNPKAKDVLPKVREAISAGRYEEAGNLCKQVQGPYNQTYQPMGDLRLTFPGDAGAVSANYQRKLELDRAVTTVTYTEGDAHFTREVFSSHPDQVIVIRLTCDQPGRINFIATADSQLRFETATAGNNTLVLRGKAPTHVDPSYIDSNDPIRYNDSEGMTFHCQVRAIAQGGSVTGDGKKLTVEKSDAVTLLLAAATSYNGPDKSPSRDGLDPAAI